MKSFSLLAAALLSAAAFAQSPRAPAPASAAPAAATSEAKSAMPASNAEVTTGKAAWYGKKFNGRKTANGERFNSGAMTAASNKLPFGTLVRVTHLKNKKSVVVRINDRGPSQPDRIIDVSRAAAAKLGMLRSGLAEVELKVVGNGKTKAKRMKKA